LPGFFRRRVRHNWTFEVAFRWDTHKAGAGIEEIPRKTRLTLPLAA
jgi:hypothetical protein